MIFQNIPQESYDLFEGDFSDWLERNGVEPGTDGLYRMDFDSLHMGIVMLMEAARRKAIDDIVNELS